MLIPIPWPAGWLWQLHRQHCELGICSVGSESTGKAGKGELIV